MTDELIKFIGQKDKLHALVKKNPTNERLKLEYKAMRNRLTAEIRKMKTDYFGYDYNNKGRKFIKIGIYLE